MIKTLMFGIVMFGLIGNSYAEIIPANVAHQETQQKRDNDANIKLQKYLDRIDMSIKTAVKEEKFLVKVDLSDASWGQEKECLEILKHDGYKVEFTSGKNGINSALKISW